MNNINDSQNTEKQIRRLAAQRQYYANAKEYSAIRFLGSIIIPTILALICLFIPAIAAYAGLYSIVFLLVDVVFLEKRISISKRKAERIQEMFDCDVLDLPASILELQTEVYDEDIMEHSNLYLERMRSFHDLENWYAPAIHLVDISAARILCQKGNVHWDATIRKAFTGWVKLLAYMMFGIVLLVGLIAKLPFSAVILILNSLLPLVRYSSRESIDNDNACRRLESLRIIFEAAWKQATAHTMNSRVLLALSRAAQDVLFAHRTESPLIPDWVFQRSRSKNESIMKQTTLEQITELKEATSKVHASVTSSKPRAQRQGKK